jgi:hypothetical protein
VAETALGAIDRNDLSQATRDRLSVLLLRLTHLCGDATGAEHAAELAEAMDQGAIIGVEARIWTAVTLLAHPATRPAGARIADAVADALSRDQQMLERAGGRWRLLLAYHSGRAGYLTLAEELLAPLFGSDQELREYRDPAFHVLRAVSAGSGADLRLYRQALLGRYRKLDGECEPSERLVVVSALADVAGRLGAYAEAMRFEREELDLRFQLFPTDHPDTLTTRNNVASWTGEAGDPAGALQLFKELLPDHERVLGADHPDTLTVRSNVAASTGGAGDPAGALQLFKELLPDQERVLGADHPRTLATRRSIGRLHGEAALHSESDTDWCEPIFLAPE